MWRGPLWIEALAALSVLLGAFFMLVASFGVLRLPDTMQRLHAPTKAATLGLIFLLVALALHVREATVVTKALLALLFIGFTAPVGAHILARAAGRLGARGADDKGVRRDTQ
jgi:multicomponent Na+:H+ antiporter subunit G